MRKTRSGSSAEAGPGPSTRGASAKVQAASGSARGTKAATGVKQQISKQTGRPPKVESEEEDDDVEMTEDTEDTQPSTRRGAPTRGAPTRGASARGRAAPPPPASDSESEEDDVSGTASASDDQGGEDVGADVGSKGGSKAGARDQRARTKGKSQSTGKGTGKDGGGGSKRPYSELISGLVSEEGLAAAYKGLPEKRAAGSASLLAGLRAQWPSWHLLLRSGFSLLLHGLGSKRELLLSFAREQLDGDGAVLVFNGYVPSCSAHRIAAAVAQALTGQGCKGSSGEQLIAMIQQEAKEWPSRHCYVIINNIDGAGLRTEPEQALLSRLAACGNVHLAASVDHVASGLLWTHTMHAAFQWQYVDATTYKPYVIETMDKPSVLVGCFHQARQRGAGAVLGVLPQNARAVFRLLVDAALEDEEYEGTDFKLLYRMCRERFLLSNEAALKSHLTEFKDHELLATRPASDGSGEVMYVPMDKEGLEQLKAELDALNTNE